MEKLRKTPPATLPPADRQRLSGLVDRLGLHQTSLRLGVGRETLARAIASVPIRRGSVALILSALEAEDDRPHG